jgi:hypothetical protein
MKKDIMMERWIAVVMERLRTIMSFFRKHPWLVLLVFFAILSALVVLYILLPPKPSVTCILVEKDTTYKAEVYEEDREAVFLLKDQVIVTGPTSAVKSKMEEVKEDIELTLIQYCDLKYPDAHDLDVLSTVLDVLRTVLAARPQMEYTVARDLDSKSFPFPPGALSDLTMHLYRIEDGQPVWEVIQEINRVGSDAHVFADPNYLTGVLTGESACGLPNTGGGSPFESVSSTPATAEWFWRQWAFEHVGVGPSLKDALQGTSINPTGAGVRVGVFDTSPFDEPAELAQPEGEEIVKETLEPVTWWETQEVTTTLYLKVSYPEMRVLTATVPAEATDVRDHGLFVAGLIHAVAPDSEIRLIRVLNEYGCGDLFTLNKALYRFIAEMEAERGTLDGTVINLSLGVLKPVLGDAESTEQGVVVIDDSLTVLVKDTVESLRAAVLLAHSRGAVVVAAAGNDSSAEGEPLPPRTPQIPARYPFVIGVAGSNVYRERACFSNWGDVSAPSGDARSDEMPGLCAKAIECSGDCDEAVISLVRSSDMDYAYWRGTSFSAPLVSGLAALVLDAGASRSICPLAPPDWVHPDRVHEAIRCGASTGDGVINMPATLFRCLP